MEIVVGISDLGGFGDVVAAAKIGDGLTMQGHDVAYKFYWNSAKQKAEMLFPGRDFPSERERDEYEYGKPLKIDAIGGSGAGLEADIFVDQVDHDSCQSGTPILLVPGFNEKYAYVSTPIVSMEGESEIAEFKSLSPTFYKPFGLDRLPNPGEENIRDVITENVRSMGGGEAKRALGECQRIGVCYAYNSDSAMNFVDWLYKSTEFSSEKLGVVVLAKTEIKREVEDGLNRGYHKFTTIGSDGEVHVEKSSNLLVAVIATQPQELTTRLFWSAEMPNLVTGGQSLSDAVYGLVFGKGQGFFYEANTWKFDSFKGIARII